MHVLSRQNNSSRLKKNVISSYTGKYWVYQVLEINFSDPLSRSLEGHKLIHDSTVIQVLVRQKSKRTCHIEGLKDMQSEFRINSRYRGEL